ncbi:Ig-like domain-containing protein [Bartonella sp. HY406]|uniref:Ig-like domain-containing protein n=1 Tax=Bartonella sp. HY406 TaxID=2979331 RepID=UPI0021C6F908|nr:tandem-95 repeat protein [Bartonella sp. HY406]UXN03902.1 Ig-like domain-containing protein [Bartonella sp. HY406]
MSTISANSNTPPLMTLPLDTSLFNTAADGFLKIDALNPNQAIHVNTGGTGKVTSFSLIFDVYVPAQTATSSWVSFFQSDVTNTNDADIFGKMGGTSYGIGIGGNYRGVAELDSWNRIGITIEKNADNSVTMHKYINGIHIDDQQITGSNAERYIIDNEKGFLIFSDNDGETSSAQLSNFFYGERVLTADEMGALGNFQPSGIIPDSLHDEAVKFNGSEFRFNNGTAEPIFGSASLEGINTTLTVEKDSGGSGTTDPALVQKVASIRDIMVTPDAENVTIDLSQYFSGEGLTYNITNKNGDVVAATLVDNQLILDFNTLGHSDISVTATDSSGKTSVVDDFRVRVAGPNAYTIAVIPDTQDYTASDGLAHIFGDMMQWLVDNKDSHNISFVSHVGDVTNNNTTRQWDIAEAALRKLDGKIPYALLPGNHDQATGGSAADHSSIHLDERFSPDKQKATNPNNFGGAYDQETNSARNTYSTFTAPDGTKWLSISLEFGPRDDVIRWAGDVIEAHPDYKVMLTTHALTSYASRQDNISLPLYDEGAGYDYGIGKDQRGSTDGETIARELLTRYPNIVMTFSGHIFGDGAQTDISYNQYGQPVYQFLVNYQNGVSREITGNGDESKGNNGGNGAIRLVTIDPDNNRITTETYFVALDKYLDGYRTQEELDRDGLTGPYKDHQEVIENIDLGPAQAYALAKAGDDIIAQATEGAEFARVNLSAAKSLLPDAVTSWIWTDKDGDIVANGKDAIAELGLGKHNLKLTAIDKNGIQTTDTIQVIVRGDRTLMVEDFNDGDAKGWATDYGAADGDTGKFLLKGTVFSRPAHDDGLAAPQASLYDQSDAANNKLVYIGEGSKDWSNYVFEATLTQLDNDALGVYFYYQDANNYYRFSMDGENNQRRLIKVENGQETLLAVVNEGTPFNIRLPITIAITDNNINVFINDKNVFGGPVVDDTMTIKGGTVGVYSSGQRSSVFDDLVVTKAITTAKAGIDQNVYDFDGNGTAAVTLDASASFSTKNIVDYSWTDLNSNVIGTGKTLTTELPAGNNQLLLKVTDSDGLVSTDRIDINVVSKSKILMHEDFSNQDSLSRFTIIDEGEFGGIGSDGRKSQWIWQDGKLVQTTELASRQLTWQGATASDYWQRGWSPLGDGVNVLRLGTYALYNDSAAMAWQNYAIEATITTPDDDVLGFLFRYTDDKNYYKLELDASGTFDRNARNGAGSIFNLIRMKDGVEQILAQMPGKYQPDEPMRLRLEVSGDKIMAYLNGEKLFAEPIGDRGHDTGTFGLYSWGNAGLAFDDLTVSDLSTIDQNAKIGTDASDIMAGGDGDDVIYGLAGNDTLLGLGGNDQLYGGDGDDVLMGGTGNDRLEGGNGNDVLMGEDGDDSLFGGNGDDIIEGGRGDDLLVGGDGSDTYIYGRGDGSDNITEVAQDSGQDVLAFHDINRSEVTLYKSHDAVELVVNDGSKIRLNLQMRDGGVELITFADGTVLNREQILSNLTNRGPSAGNDVLATIDEDTPSFLIPFSSLLANDYDLDGDSLTIVSIGTPIGGTAVIEGDAIRFSLTQDFNGTASFNYVVSDGRGGTSQASASFVVRPVNDAPVTSSIDVETKEDEAISGQVVASDVDGDILTYTIKPNNGPKNGTATVDAKTGAWTYTPNLNVNGFDSFIVLVSDGNGGFAESTINITITPVNDAPIAVADFGSVAENETAFFDLTANDIDVDGDTISLTGFQVTTVEGIALTPQQAQAAFSIVDGKLFADPANVFAALNKGEFATVTLEYTISDGNGGTATGTATIRIDGYTPYNIIHGTNAADILIGTNGDDMIDGLDGNDTIISGNGDDLISGGKGNDRIMAGAGNDIVDGGDGNDIIMGNDGNDVLNGGDGNDQINGGTGDDYIIGGKGNDILWGGDGNDTFVFQAVDNGHDLIMDFKPGATNGDIIVLAKEIFADFDALMTSGHITDTANGAQIVLNDGSTITVNGVRVQDFTIDDFRFA